MKQFKIQKKNEEIYLFPSKLLLSEIVFSFIFYNYYYFKLIQNNILYFIQAEYFEIKI